MGGWSCFWIWTLDSPFDFFSTNKKGYPQKETPPNEYIRKIIPTVDGPNPFRTTQEAMRKAFLVGSCNTKKQIQGCLGGAGFRPCTVSLASFCVCRPVSDHEPDPNARCAWLNSSVVHLIGIIPHKWFLFF